MDGDLPIATEYDLGCVIVGNGIDVDLDGTISVNQYIHTQSTASNEWTINHNLNKYPSVEVVDSAGSIVVGDIQYIDLDTVKVVFNGAFSGKAFLN